MAEKEKCFDGLSRLVCETDRIASEKDRVIVALDGRCASGKTTLAAILAKRVGATVFHMDDFFLRPEQRTSGRLSEPGGNVDRERFYAEVLRPLSEGADTVVYRPFDCKTMSLSPPVEVRAGKTVIVEGSYSLHPDLRDKYDLRVFLTVSPEEQRRRITERDPSRSDAFFTRWIPMEEAYFGAFAIAENCDIIIKT